MLIECTYNVFDRRCFLADRHVDTGAVLTLLVDDGVDRDSCLAGLAIANDQLTLTTANRHHGINRFQTGLQRLGHRLTRNNARGDFFDRSRQLGVDLTLAVDRLAKCINHATTQLWANWHLENTACAFDGIALGDVLVTTENHRTDGITLEV